MNRRNGLEYMPQAQDSYEGLWMPFSRRIRGDIMVPLNQVPCQHGDPGCVSDSTEHPGLRGTEPGKDGDRILSFLVRYLQRFADSYSVNSPEGIYSLLATSDRTT